MAGAAAIILASVAAVGALTGAGMSFSQASKQKKAAARAKLKSDAMMRAAEKRLKANFHQGLNVPLDAYEKQREMSVLGSQTAMQALQEGDPRNLAAGVGAVGQVASMADEKMRIALAEDLYKNREMKADKEAALNDQLINMQLGQAKQAKQEEQDATESANAAVIAGVQGIGEAAAIGAEATPLFGKGKTNKQIADISTNLKTQKRFANMDESQIRTALKKGATVDQIAAYTEDPSSVPDWMKELFPDIEWAADPDDDNSRNSTL
jgi:hypothetical protein